MCHDAGDESPGGVPVIRDDEKTGVARICCGQGRDDGHRARGWDSANGRRIEGGPAHLQIKPLAAQDLGAGVEDIVKPAGVAARSTRRRRPNCL